MTKSKRNKVASILSGILFASAWWIIIDTTCQYRSSTDFDKRYHLIGIIGTLALILTNCISNSQLRNDSDTCLKSSSARIFLFLSFLLAFGSLIASAWVLFGLYIVHKKEKFYPGIAIFIQNLGIFISTLILKFVRKEEDVY